MKSEQNGKSLWGNSIPNAFCFLLLCQAGRIEKFDGFAKDFMANQVRFKKNNNNISLIILGSLSNDNDNGGDYIP